MRNFRRCPSDCIPNKCFCKLRPAPTTQTPCEDKENDGIAGFYSDETIGNVFLNDEENRYIFFELLIKILFLSITVSISELQKTVPLEHEGLPNNDCDNSRLECHAHGSINTYLK